MIEPLTLVISAIVAGLSDVAKEAVKDGYGVLKTYLRRKVAGNEEAQDTLRRLEQKPEEEGRQAALKVELKKIGADQDEELLRLAKAIMEKADEKGAQAGKYNITISSSYGFVIGDNAQVEQKFDIKSDK